MLYQQRKYLRFLLEANNQHGVHSPFIYKLVTQCFYKKISKDLYEKFLNDKKHVKFTQKKIDTINCEADSKIGKKSGISNKKAKILIKTVDYFRPENILAIGTCLHFKASAIKTGNKSASILTVDKATESNKQTRNLIDQDNLDMVKVENNRFSKTLSKSIENRQFDFIFFDENHTKKATLDYFEACLKTIHNDSFFIFNNIYRTAEIQEVWSVIKKHSKVTITVDVFYLGIVFFRKEQAKEHFKIRV
jgi:predicted O-methyltransferase YrrM